MLGAASRIAARRVLPSRLMSSVPVIDIGPFLDGSNKEKVAGQLSAAAEHIGFFGFKNHGVDPDLIAEMEDVTRRYFDLPVGEKRKIAMTEEYPYGYNGFQEEALATGWQGSQAPPDLKECFAIGPNNPLAEMPPIQWPDAPADFKDVWQRYYVAMEDLGSNVCRIFAVALDLPENWFEEKIDHHRSVIRALNYPETEKDATFPDDVMRAGAHSDYGTFTCLLQDPVGGLQVMGRHGWEDVPYAPGTYVINIGDLMARWTNDKWKSTVHRVVPKHPRRQSIAFFHNANHDLLVETIPTCVSESNPAKYEPILAWEHLMQKHRASTDY